MTDISEGFKGFFSTEQDKGPKNIVQVTGANADINGWLPTATGQHKISILRYEIGAVEYCIQVSEGVWDAKMKEVIRLLVFRPEQASAGMKKRLVNINRNLASYIFDPNGKQWRITRWVMEDDSKSRPGEILIVDRLTWENGVDNTVVESSHSWEHYKPKP